VRRMLVKLGFTMLKIPVFYKDVATKRIKKTKNFVYVFELKKGLVKKK